MDRGREKTPSALGVSVVCTHSVGSTVSKASTSAFVYCFNFEFIFLTR